MRKIMLVIEDYKDLVGLENFFRRLGFDVLSVGKEILVSDAMAGFVPDLVIANAKGRLVDGVRLAPKVLRHAPNAKIALLFPTGAQPPLPNDVKGYIDALIETPYRPRGVINVVAQLCGIDPAPILEKYEKLEFGKSKDLADVKLATPKAPGGENDPIHLGDRAQAGTDIAVRVPALEMAEPEAATIRSEPPKPVIVWDPIKTPGKAASARSERSDVYDTFLAANDDGPVDGVLPHARLAEAGRALKREAEAEKESLEKLHIEKQEFIKALFVQGQGRSRGK